MQLQLKPTTQRAGIAGGLVGVGIALLNLIPFLRCLLAPLTVLIVLLVPLGTGAYSVMLARQAGAPSGNTGQDAVDGALAGSIGALIAGIVSLILSVPRTALYIGVKVDSWDIGLLSLLFELSGVVFAAIFGGILGAVGGAVYGAVMA